MTLDIEPTTQYKFEFCNIHDYYVETTKQWFCKNCYQMLCDDCYQNRRKHECILIPKIDEVKL